MNGRSVRPQELTFYPEAVTIPSDSPDPKPLINISIQQISVKH